MPANFIISKISVYIGFIDNTKIVFAFMEEVSEEVIREIYKQFRPHAPLQYIETHKVRLAIQI